MTIMKRHTKAELNFWVMPNAGIATRSLLQKQIDEFESLRTDVKVNLVVHPWSLAWNRLMDVVKGRSEKTVPDILQVGTTWVSTLSYLGALEKTPASLASTAQQQTQSLLGDTNSYCVPWFIDIRVLYYRRDIFENFQLDPHLLSDWRGFNRLCGDLQRSLAKSNRYPKIIAPLCIPGQKPGVLMHDLAPWIWQAGGDFVSENSKVPDLVNGALFQGCQFYFDLINQGFMPIPNAALPPGNFFTGHYAMQFSGSWPVDSYLTLGWPYGAPEVAMGAGVVPLPAGPQGRYTFLGGSNLGVSSASENKELAWEFIQFMVDPDRMTRHARSIGALPARLSDLEPLFSRHPGARDAFFSSFGHARRLPRIIELGSVEQIIYKMSVRVISLIRAKEYTPRRLQQEIEAANNEIKSLLSVHRYGGVSGKAA